MGRGRRNRRGQSEGRRVEEGRRGVGEGVVGEGGGGGRTHHLTAYFPWATGVFCVVSNSW